MTKALEQHLANQLAAYKKSGRYRTLESNSFSQGRTINLAGQDLINFCSNDYLGLCADNRLKKTAITAVEQYGVGAGAAALLSGRHSVHQQLEKTLANFSGYPAALVYSSGYLANLGLISALVGRHDEVHHDKLNHASLIDAVKLSGAQHKRFPHADYFALQENLAASSAERKWVITDGVFSMDGDLAPLSEIAQIASNANAPLIVDDAHGFGILKNGKGTAAHFGLNPTDVPIQIITFGKALGSAGAAVLGSEDLISYLVQCSRTFIYDTALPPMVAASTIAAIDVLTNDNRLIESLNRNISYFRTLCNESAIAISQSSTPIQPLILGSEKRAMAAANFLRDNGIYVRAVRPPTVPAGTSRLRICLSAAHKSSDIEKLVSLISKIPSEVSHTQ